MDRTDEDRVGSTAAKELLARSAAAAMAGYWLPRGIGTVGGLAAVLWVALTLIEAAQLRWPPR